MKDREKELEAQLSAHFIGRAQRKRMLAKLVLGIVQLGTINYSKLSLTVNPSVKKESNFKRIQRFIKSYDFDVSSYIQLVWSLFIKEENWVALTIDRTNWKFGKEDINILMLGISYKGTMLPLVWTMLDKRGNSSTAERTALVEQLYSYLTTSQIAQIKILLADREFIGKEWFSYLKKRSLNFAIRIRNNSKMRRKGTHKEQQVGQFFDQKHFKVLRKKRIIFGHELYVAGQNSTSKDSFVLVSNLPLSKGRIFYAQRWGIEVFFAACKKRGFNFEDTHVTKLNRLSKLMFLVALAFIWSIRTGEFLSTQKGYKAVFKKIGDKTVRLFSLFRVGLDYLRQKILGQQSLYYEIKLLSCT